MITEDPQAAVNNNVVVSATSPMKTIDEPDTADSEVSEINTQPINDQIQETYSRPMSTTSTTTVSNNIYLK